jgi:NAD-dependent dihydropyrimidine dehydrogenase PreA subunit
MRSEETVTEKNETSVVRRPSVVIHCELCKGCGRCVIACPNGVLALSEAYNKLGYHPAEANEVATCTGCGMCFYACPEPGAVTVYRKQK